MLCSYKPLRPSISYLRSPAARQLLAKVVEAPATPPLLMVLCVLVSGLAALSGSRWLPPSRCRSSQLCADPRRVGADSASAQSCGSADAEPQISVLDEWERLPDGRFTGRLSSSQAGAEVGAEVWITPRSGSGNTDVAGTAQITSAGGRPYLLGTPKVEDSAQEGALAGLKGVVEPLKIYKKSAVVGKYIKETAPPEVREAMRARDAGFLRVAVGVAVLAYGAGLYVGSQPVDGRDMASGEQPVLARSTAPSRRSAPAVQGALGDFPKTRAVLDTFKGTLDTS